MENWRSRNFLARGRNVDLGSLRVLPGGLIKLFLL